uniref:Uncharacterized protein n=1 Tax=Oryza sativa subsp. japonica TaxID=39947 RepID=Q6ZIY8_ORYSJ|nr:hypothetical protein [Oryza sativa Japonica Group]
MDVILGNNLLSSWFGVRSVQPVFFMLRTKCLLIADLVCPSFVAVDRRSPAVVVKQKVAAASSSSPSPSVDLLPLFWSPLVVSVVSKVRECVGSIQED